MENNCENILSKINDYIDNELLPEEIIAFNKHIKECENCKKELLEAKTTLIMVKSLKELKLPDPDENFTLNIIRKIEEEKAKNKVVKFTFIKSFAAGIAILGIVGITLVNFYPTKGQVSQNSQENAVTKEHAENLKALFYGEENSTLVDAGFPTDQYGLIDTNGI